MQEPWGPRSRGISQRPSLTMHAGQRSHPSPLLLILLPCLVFLTAPDITSFALHFLSPHRSGRCITKAFILCPHSCVPTTSTLPDTFVNGVNEFTTGASVNFGISLQILALCHLVCLTLASYLGKPQFFSSVKWK